MLAYALESGAAWVQHTARLTMTTTRAVYWYMMKEPAVHRMRLPKAFVRTAGRDDLQGNPCERPAAVVLLVVPRATTAPTKSTWLLPTPSWAAPRCGG